MVMAELLVKRDPPRVTVTSSMTVDQRFRPPYDEIHNQEPNRLRAFRWIMQPVVSQEKR